MLENFPERFERGITFWRKNFVETLALKGDFPRQFTNAPTGVHEILQRYKQSLAVVHGHHFIEIGCPQTPDPAAASSGLHDNPVFSFSYSLQNRCADLISLVCVRLSPPASKITISPATTTEIDAQPRSEIDAQFKYPVADGLVIA